MEKKVADELNINQEQIHSILFSRNPGWKDIIYDLINTEQLDPWDVDILVLTDKYLERIEGLEETDFFISSKILLAASFLLRIKSEILLDKHLKSIDEILFGREEKKKYSMERIEPDEEIPELIPKSPMPRFRKVTLKELIESLNRAIRTENRRIKKEIINRNALRQTGIVLPRKGGGIKNRIKEIYRKLFQHFRENDKKKVSYRNFIGEDKDERIISFAPLLHLEHQKKVWLEQENPFGEIHIWLREEYLKNNPAPFSELGGDMINLKGKIVKGYQAAIRTLRQQSSYFEKEGIKRKFLVNGSINVDISPKKWKITNPDFEFKNILWKPDFAEDFNFIKLELKFGGRIYQGYLYNPKRTKNPRTIMEILSEHIKGIEYGKEIELIIPEDKIRFL